MANDPSAPAVAATAQAPSEPAPQDTSSPASPAPAPITSARRRWHAGFFRFEPLWVLATWGVGVGAVWTAGLTWLGYVMITAGIAGIHAVAVHGGSLRRRLLQRFPALDRAAHFLELHHGKPTSRTVHWLILSLLLVVVLAFLVLLLSKDRTGGFLLLGFGLSLAALLGYFGWNVCQRRWSQILLKSSAGFVLGICGNFAASAADRALIEEHKEQLSFSINARLDALLGTADAIKTDTGQLISRTGAIKDDTTAILATLTAEERRKQTEDQQRRDAEQVAARLKLLRDRCNAALEAKEASAFRSFAQGQTVPPVELSADDRTLLERVEDPALSALAAVATGRLPDAAQLIKAGARRPGHDRAELLRLEGEVAFYSGRMEDAVRAFDAACRLRPTAAPAQLGRIYALANATGHYHADEGDLRRAAEEAIQHLRSDRIRLARCAHAVGVLLLNHGFKFTLVGVRLPNKPNHRDMRDVDLGFKDPCLFFDGALEAFTEQTHPREWASASLHNALAIVRRDEGYADRALWHAEDALRVYMDAADHDEYLAAHRLAAKAMVMLGWDDPRLTQHLDRLEASLRPTDPPHYREFVAEARKPSTAPPRAPTSRPAAATRPRP